MYTSNYYRQPNTNTVFSIKPSQHQLKILEILRAYLPDFAKEFTLTPDPNIINTEEENYISAQLIVFLTNLDDCSYMFGFQAKGPDIFVNPKKCRLKSLPLFVIEAKRLRAASKKEYVTSGITRFKTNQHGVDHNYAAMLGYVQENNFLHWHGKINTWIGELAVEDNSMWSKSENLEQVSNNVLGEYESIHSRIGGKPIKLYHFWINI